MEAKVMVLPDGRVSRKDAAAFLGREPKTLADWHTKGVGPKARKVGGRVFYHIDDLRTFTGAAAPQSLPAASAPRLNGRPRTTDDGSVKRYPLNMRVSARMRSRIQSAAKACGLSMAQEVERRLMASFDYQDAADYLAQFLATRRAEEE